MCVVHGFIKRIFLLQQARPPWAERALWRLTFSCRAAVVDSSASVLSLQLRWFRCLQQSSALPWRALLTEGGARPILSRVPLG